MTADNLSTSFRELSPTAQASTLNQPCERSAQHRHFDAWSTSLTSRQRVLLHAQPLILLQHYAGIRDADHRHYDPLCLAIKTFDVVIDQSGFGSDVVRDTIAEGLRPLLVALDWSVGVEPSASRHDEFVDRLLGMLKNDQHRQVPFEIEYQDFDRQGLPSRRSLSFSLLKEAHGYSGQIVLKLTSEAINLFLSALDLDIEDAQAANEAVVESQLARGKFNEAVQSAQNARGQSLRYEQKIAALIDRTKRDIDRVDWRGEVHQMLVEAVGHVDTRLRIEENIIASAQEKLDLLPDEDPQQQPVAEVIRLMRDCRNRHLNLNKRLMTARGEFLEQQARQSFVAVRAFQRIELLEGVLAPLLGQPVRAAERLTGTAISLLVGPVPPPVLSVARLVAWQLQPRRLYLPGETAVPEQDLAESDGEMRRFDRETVTKADGHLEVIAFPSRLSDLIADLMAEKCPDALCDSVVLRVLQQFDPDAENSLELDVTLADRGFLRTSRYFGDDMWIAPREPDHVGQ